MAVVQHYDFFNASCKLCFRDPLGHKGVKKYNPNLGLFGEGQSPLLALHIVTRYAHDLVREKVITTTVIQNLKSVNSLNTVKKKLLNITY